jgi:hypothetical protein
MINKSKIKFYTSIINYNFPNSCSQSILIFSLLFSFLSLGGTKISLSLQVQSLRPHAGQITVMSERNFCSSISGVWVSNIGWGCVVLYADSNSFFPTLPSISSLISAAYASSLLSGNSFNVFTKN